jgi:hypothetical protein
MKILVICHGTKHTFDGCYNNILPITAKSIRNMTFLDIKEEVEPDIVANWKENIPIKLYNKFDLLSSICGDGDLFITNTGFNEKSFDNLIKVLKHKGYFIMDGLSISNIKNISIFWVKLLEKEKKINSLTYYPGFKPNLTRLSDLEKNPFTDDPETIKFLNRYIAFSIEESYPKLKWIKDPKAFINLLYETYSDKRYVKNILDKFNDENLSLFQKI